MLFIMNVLAKNLPWRCNCPNTSSVDDAQRSSLNDKEEYCWQSNSPSLTIVIFDGCLNYWLNRSTILVCLWATCYCSGCHFSQTTQSLWISRFLNWQPWPIIILNMVLKWDNIQRRKYGGVNTSMTTIGRFQQTRETIYTFGTWKLALTVKFQNTNG